MQEIFNQKYVPIRERRLGATNVFGGPISDLVRQSGDGCLACKKRSFGQTFNCLMSMSLSILMSIPDIVIIFHGPVGCGSMNHGAETFFQNGHNSRGTQYKAPVWLSTNLNESDIINGGEKKLEEAVLQTDTLHRPAAIVIVTTCAPGIIGDDVDELVSRLRKRVAAKLVLAHCEGFKTSISATAYDIVFHGLIKSFEFEEERDEAIIPDDYDELRRRYQRENTVNLFNVYSIGRTDELELVRILKALGLEVNIYPNFAHPDAFRKISESALNISVCPTHDDYFFKYLESRFGTPYVLKHMPVGIGNTAKWLMDVARPLGLEERARKLAETETLAWEKDVARYRDTLKGKRVLISGGEVRVVATASLMRELGMEVLGIRGHHYDQFGDALYEGLMADDPGLKVNIATTQIFELVNMLNKTKPDLYLGHAGSNVWAGKLGIPSVPVFSQSQYYMGFRGAFEVARRAKKALANSALQENLKRNLSLPFKKEWYGKSPFHYIVE